MRIAILTSSPLDHAGAERDAAIALGDALGDHGADPLVVGLARSAAMQTAGRLTIRALERSGAAALSHTEAGARQVAVSGPTWTWAADAATRRIIGQGDLDLVVLLGDDDSPLARVALDAAPSAQRVGTKGLKKAAKELIALAGDHARRPSPLALPEPILADFHLHTYHSHDCSTSIEELVGRAQELGIGALCVTDHNSVAGGYAAKAHVEAHGLPLHVAVASEIKTHDQGEVIGLYLREDVPPGMSFADTVEAIRAQGGFVYVPHPFDAHHAIPPEPLLERLAPLLDAVEVANGRLAREHYNEHALAFARRLGLPEGAGSDEHVIAGLFTAGLELPAFHDPASLALALGDARIVRNPRSFLALQARKWFRTRRRPPRAE
ncbi:MAG: PHP domain-containing protein [Gaiellales bacterium]